MAKRTRRQFLQASAAAGAGFWVAGGLEVQAKQGPNDRLNIAFIGAGGQGGSNLSRIAPRGRRQRALATENVVALCDVDDRRAAGAFAAHPKAARYTDFRVMLEKQKDIDAVVVSTPDHVHAAAAMMAMRMGKHCYTEKPLTHSVYEARQMREMAAKMKVATQMGNHGTAANGLRQSVEIIRAGAIGDIREVHVWTNRPIWPQNIPRPKDAEPVPKGVSWDLWLGPAPPRPYHQGTGKTNGTYLPFNWRGWWDFGTGALGDMACHTMNMPYLALRLGAPISVEANLDVKGSTNIRETAPMGVTVTYEFPARNGLPAVRLFWYERRRPPMELFQGQKVSASGSLLIGSKGTLYSSDDNGSSRALLPLADFKGYQPPKPTLPRSPGHHAEWIRACKGGPPAMSNFVDHAGPLTEMVLLGNVAMRLGKRIVWDAEQLRCVDCAAADQYLRREYRKGWSL
jgi:predicted dehydrogenase